MADGKKGSDVDRWRRMLEDAEREHQQNAERWQQQESILCTAISHLTHQLDGFEELANVIAPMREAVKGKLDIDALRDASEQLVHKEIQPTSSSTPPDSDHSAADLHYLLNKLSLPGLHQDSLQRLLLRLQQVKQRTELADVLDEAVVLLQPLLSRGTDNASAQVCSLMVSEIMVQLLERLSLPQEVSERLASLRKSLEEGVDQGAWASVLEEIADMAADIRGKIHAERIETERFLKGVTQRLDDVDGFLAGSEESLKQSQRDGEQLNAAVNKEMKGLEASVKASEDISKLRHEISLRLKNITEHVSIFRSNQIQQFSQTEQEVKQLKERLRKVESEAKSLRERIVHERKQAITDSLTGLNNRLAFDERMNSELARWRRFQQPSCLAVWDVDFFKRINDDYGHVAGDNALKSIAKIIAGKIRETDFLARYGGEEFVLYMPGADLKSAVSVADKLRQAVEEAGFHFRGQPVKITISCGVTQVQEGDTPQSLFERADQALYQSKEQGRNRVTAI